MPGRETRIKDRILDTLRAGGAFAEKTHGEAMQARGIPDIIGCIRGTFLGLEVKQPGEVPTPLQAYHLIAIRKAGGYGVAVDNVRIVEEAMKAWPFVCSHCFRTTMNSVQAGCCNADERRCDKCQRENP